MKRIPTLIGIAGHVKGEKIPLEYGVKMAVGRSRESTVCLLRMASVKGLSEEARAKDESLRTVSGKHFEITMYNAKSIELVNVSPNGTRLDDKPVQQTIIDDLDQHAHLIKFGKNETFSLELADAED
jgi:hypothetical protein